MLLHTATANGFQMVTSGVQSKAVSDWLITSVEVSAWRLTACPHWRGLFLGEGIKSPPLGRWGSSSSSCFPDPCLQEWPPPSLHGTFAELGETRARGSN